MVELPGLIRSVVEFSSELGLLILIVRIEKTRQNPTNIIIANVETKYLKFSIYFIKTSLMLDRY